MSSDPNDLLEVGKHVGSGGVGAAVVAGLMKLVMGGGFADLKERMAELKADTKEQIASLKDMMERSERRHDSTIEQVAIAKQSTAALHQRFDVLERRIEVLEHELREVAR